MTKTRADISSIRVFALGSHIKFNALEQKFIWFDNHLIIKIPSAIVPDEFNYLLNPRHPDCIDFQILEVKDFIYDVRLKLK